MTISPIGTQPVLPTRSTADTHADAPAPGPTPAPTPETGATGTLPVTVQLPDPMPGHLQLDIDRASGQFVGRIVNKKTGAVISQIPSKEALRLAAAFRQGPGGLVHRKV